MGSTLIQRATIDTLENRLDDQKQRLEETDAENQQLEADLAAREQLDSQFGAQATEQLLRGRLDQVPVMVFAAEGIDEEGLDGVRRSIVNAGADFRGTFRTTERLALNTEDDIADLAVVLDNPSSDPDELRAVLIRRFGDALLRAAEVPTEDDTPVITVPPRASPPPRGGAGAHDPAGAAAARRPPARCTGSVHDRCRPPRPPPSTTTTTTIPRAGRGGGRTHPGPGVQRLPGLRAAGDRGTRRRRRCRSIPPATPSCPGRTPCRPTRTSSSRWPSRWPPGPRRWPRSSPPTTAARWR